MNEFYRKGYLDALEKLGGIPTTLGSAMRGGQGPLQAQGPTANGGGLWSKIKGVGNVIDKGVTGVVKHVTRPGFGTTQNRGL